jgi:hypothetical protein
MMKNLYFLLTAILLCTGCTKGTGNITQNDIDDTASTSSIFSAVADDTVSPQMPESETKSLLQKIIEDYPLTFPPEIDTYPRQLACQIEGNFTNSGNREIIGFYEAIDRFKSIDAVFCFVCDSSGEKVEKIYYIDYVLAHSFSEENFERETGLTEALGRPIIREERKIGYVGDFNGNGKEELFLYSTSGLGGDLEIFEFKETEFVEFLDIRIEGRRKTVITDIDLEKKIIGIKIDIVVNEGQMTLITDEDGNIIGFDEFSVVRIVKMVSYIWNKADQRYEILNTETKEYRWNRETSQYEEL